MFLHLRFLHFIVHTACSQVSNLSVKLPSFKIFLMSLFRLAALKINFVFMWVSLCGKEMAGAVGK
jgi:hypothetical protein